MIEKKIKNIELVTLALYQLGGTNKNIDTEEIAVKADEIDNQRFKWRNRKYKKFIDRGLILESLNAARVRKIGSFLKGNDDKGWMLTAEGLKFCKNSKYKFNHSIVRKKRLSKIDKKYLIREENRIKNTDAFNKYFYGNKANITAEEIKKLFKVDDYTSKPDLQRRIVNLLDNFKDEDNIYKLIDSYKKEVLQYVN